MRLAGSKRTDPMIVETVEDRKVAFRLTWKSKGERVVSPKLHTCPLGEVEVIEALNLSEEAAKAEAPKVEEPKERPRRRKATAAA